MVGPLPKLSQACLSRGESRQKPNPPGSMRRKQIEAFFGLANLEPTIGIHLQRFDGRPAGCGATCRAIVVPAKVLVPIIAPRMEKRHELIGLWIDCKSAVGFVEVAGWATPCKVFKS